MLKIIVKTCTVILAVFLFAGTPSLAVSVRAADGKVLDVLSEDGDSFVRQQKDQILRALDTLAEYGFSPAGIVERFLKGDRPSLTLPEDLPENLTEPIPESITQAGQEAAKKVREAGEGIAEQVKEAGEDAARETTDTLREESEGLITRWKDSIKETLHGIVDGIVDGI